MRVRYALAVVVGMACTEHGSHLTPAELVAVVHGDTPVTSATFPTATATGSESTLTIRLLDAGDESTGPITVALTGASELAIAETSCTDVRLDGGHACAITLAFTPTSRGTFSAQLTATASPGGEVHVDVSARAVTLGFDTNYLEFHVHEVGTASDAIVQVTNLGERAVLDPLEVAGNAFRRLDTSCGAELAAQESCAVTIRFVAPELGQQLGTLTARLDGALFAIGLVGFGGGRITVIPGGTGAGSVTGPDIACGSTGGACTVVTYSPMQLTASPLAGSTFAGWGSPLCSDASLTCTLPADAAPRTVSPIFSAP